MWNLVPPILAVALPLSGLILSIAVKIINGKIKKQLPECAATFKELKAEMEAMKKGSTDRMAITHALKATMETTQEQYRELRSDFKNLSDSVVSLCVQLGAIGQDIKYISEDIKEIKENKGK